MADARTLITQALIELGVINAAEAPSSEDAELGLARLNLILDDWNAEYGALYAETIDSYELDPGTSPHTFGPTGATFTLTQRPVSVRSANLVIDGIRVPLALRDAAWWMGLTDPTTQGQPSDAYYEPAWPNGQLYLWPVPDAADTLELLTRTALAQVTLDTDMSLPPGYLSALTLTLAEQLAAPFQVQAAPMTLRNADKARARIFAHNSRIPRLMTRDAGMPGGGSAFDYRTGR